MKKQIPFLFISIIFLLLSSSFSLANSLNFIQNDQLENNSLKAKWTVMYYICGDSNMDVYVEPLLENLSKVGSNENLNLVALKDGMEQDDSKLYYIDHAGNRIELNNDFGWPNEVDMSNTNTLERFCTQMIDAFPAEYYSLITFASGGTGWQLYCLKDKDGNRGLTIPDFSKSLNIITKNSLQKIDVLFVSCAMGMIEIAYEFQPYINYIVGTQDCFPHDQVVCRFFEAVWDLKNNTNLTPEDFAKRAPARLRPEPFYYYESYNGKLPILNKISNKLPFKGLHTVIHYPSWSVINLSRINELVDSVDNLSSYLILHLNDKKTINEIKNVRNNVKESGKCFSKFKMWSAFHSRYNLEITAYDGFIDLYNFTLLIKKSFYEDYVINLCNQITDCMNKTISDIKKVSCDSSNGLNIYFPSNKRMYNMFVIKGKIPSPYEELEFSIDTRWDDFLKEYFHI